MPRYEFSEGSSNKFWQIDLKGKAFTTTHGRIGSSGTVTLKEWPDAATAKKEYDKLVAQKTKKGYALVDGEADEADEADEEVEEAPKKKGKAAKAEKPAKAAKAKGKAAADAGGAKVGAFNKELAKVIDDTPSDDSAWSVYADWLQGEGDPRGELATIQEGLRANPKDKTLLSAEKKHIKTHAEALFGKFGMFLRAGKKGIPGATGKMHLDPDTRQTGEDEAPLKVLWRAGFFQEIFFGHPGYDWSPGGGDDDDEDGEGGGDGFGDYDMPALVDELLSSPVARFCNSLRLGMPSSMDDGECDYSAMWKKLAKNEQMKRLRRLYIGDVTQEESEVSWIDVGDISKLYPVLTKLRRLTIRGGNLKLGTIALPELKELTIITGGLDKKNVASICAAKWPQLEKLELWLGQKNYGSNITIKDLQPIFDGKAFPKLKELGLRNSEIADEIAAKLPTAKILSQLTELDLSKGTMSDTGAATLIEHADAFKHLARLDLSDNYIAKQSAAAAKIAPVVRTRPQRTVDVYDGVEYRYTALGE